MRSQTFIASIVLLLPIIWPTGSQAVNVRIGANDVPDGTTGGVTLSGSPTVNLDCPAPATEQPAPTCRTTPAGPAREYTNPEGKIFTISRCSGTGCSAGRARVFVTDGATDRLSFTDALITNVQDPLIDPGPHSLIIRIESGRYTEVPAGATLYPYAVELSGSFQGPGASTGNRIQVWAYANGRALDNPSFDTGEPGCEGFSETCFSISAPPYKPAGTTQFSPKEYQDIFCGDDSEDTNNCVPDIDLVIKLTLKAGNSARLPGSIGAVTVNTPSDQGGREKMADIFAALGPKGGEVYRVRLETSPGTDRTIEFRNTGVRNSDTAWVTRRGGGDDDDDHHDGNVSQTRVKIENNGTGEVRAKGLCPAMGGCPASNALPVRVYCGSEFGQPQITYQAVLNLNHKGDGNADLIPGLPCEDPAVLIMEPPATPGGSSDSWVAAPMVF